jgi:hypothetical protein
LPSRCPGATITVEERRRTDLHRAASRTWGEEAADTLFDLVTPAGHELATRADLAGFRTDVDHRFDVLEQRLESMEHRLTATFERRIADAITSQTRTLVLSQLGALVVIAGLALGLR